MMTEGECRDAVRALMMTGEVSCSDLFRELGDYGFQDGRYDAAQKFLGDMGWVYHIGIDAWRPGILTPAIERLVELFDEALMLQGGNPGEFDGGSAAPAPAPMPPMMAPEEEQQPMPQMTGIAA